MTSAHHEWMEREAASPCGAAPERSAELDALTVAVRAILPDEVASDVVRIETCPYDLYVQEARLIASASERRRTEFNAGRVCARQALASLGLNRTLLPIAESRAPLWPRGVVGSLSHDGDYCVAAVARRGGISAIGVDIMKRNRLHRGLVSIVCTPDEERYLSTQAGRQAETAEILFSSKESVYKCVSADGRRALEFKDIELAFERRRRVAQTVSLKQIRGTSALRTSALTVRHACTAHYIVTCAWH